MFDFEKVAEKCGATHKQNLGVYQFYTSELECYKDTIIKEVISKINDHRLNMIDENDLYITPYCRGFVIASNEIVDIINRHFDML